MGKSKMKERQYEERRCCSFKESEKGKLHWGIFKQILKEAGRASSYQGEELSH